MLNTSYSQDPLSYKLSIVLCGDRECLSEYYDSQFDSDNHTLGHTLSQLVPCKVTMNGVRRLFTASSSSGGTSTTTATAVDPSVARADGSTAWTPLIIGRALSQSAEQPNRDQKRPDGSPSHSLERPGQLQTTSSILKIRPTESPESISMSPSANRGRMPTSVSVTKGSASALIRKKPYDDLLLDLLASESAIECKGFQTLEPKEMAALKKVYITIFT